MCWCKDIRWCIAQAGFNRDQNTLLPVKCSNIPAMRVAQLPYHKEPKSGLCVFLVFADPLHTARRAMVVACRCPHGQQRFSNTPNMTEYLSPTTEGHTGASLAPIRSKPPDKKRGKNMTKEINKGKRQPRAGLARPPRPLTSVRRSPSRPLSP